MDDCDLVEAPLEALLGGSEEDEDEE